MDSRALGAFGVSGITGRNGSMELVIVSEETSDDGGFYGSIPSLIVFVFKASQFVPCLVRRSNPISISKFGLF